MSEKRFSDDTILAFRRVVREIYPVFNFETGEPKEPTKVDPAAVAQNPELFVHFNEYENVFMQQVYEEVERQSGLFLETSVQNHKGEVNALTNGGHPGCECKATWRYEDETEAMFKILLEHCRGRFYDDMLEAAFDAAVNLLEEWIAPWQ